MKDAILEAIAVNSIFGIDEVHRVYEIFKSYDLLVAACEFAQRTGYANLECACILAKSAAPPPDPIARDWSGEDEDKAWSGL
jgi:hypothetical protein